MLRMKYTILLLFLIPCLASAQTRYFVKPSAQGTGTGLNWADAFNDLQTAIGVSLANDEIWVAAGTYLPTTSTDRLISFQPKSGIRLYGGFSGSESLLSERNWGKYQTILSGDIGLGGDTLDNSYNVVYLHLPDSTTVLDGFIIRDGNANFNGASPNRDRKKCGGGIYINGQDWDAYPTIENCTIVHNTSRNSGGGIMINGGGLGSVAPLIKKCRFENNRSEGTGGGLYRFGGSWVERGTDLEDCLFVNNRAKTYGGGYSYTDTERNDNIEFIRDTFRENNANLNGGALYMDAGRQGNISIKINTCDFDANTSTSSQALAIITSSFLPVDSIYILKNNFRNHYGLLSQSGIIFISLGGKISSKALISNNEINNNTCNTPIFVFEYINSNSIKFSSNEYNNNKSSWLLNLSHFKLYHIENDIIQKNIFNYSIINIADVQKTILNNCVITKNQFLSSPYFLFADCNTVNLRVIGTISDNLFFNNYFSTIDVGCSSHLM